MQSRFQFAAVLSRLALLAGITPAAFGQGRLDIFVTPVPNAPFSALVEVERTIVQQNGAVTHLKTLRNIGRDGHGRIYTESRLLLPVASTASPRLLGMHLYDPQTRVSTMLDAQQKTFWTATVNRPPATQPPGSNLPPSEFTKQEDLGIRQIDGLAAHGMRETQAIPADDSGKEIVTTDESWYSEDLRINLVIKHDDPRHGSVAMTVTNMKIGEPDPALFRVPDGYVPAGSQLATENSPN